MRTNVFATRQLSPLETMRTCAEQWTNSRVNNNIYLRNLLFTFFLFSDKEINGRRIKLVDETEAGGSGGGGGGRRRSRSRSARSRSRSNSPRSARRSRSRSSRHSRSRSPPSRSASRSKSRTKSPGKF
jgi:hypothetical protein